MVKEVDIYRRSIELVLSRVNDVLSSLRRLFGYFPLVQVMSNRYQNVLKKGYRSTVNVSKKYLFNWSKMG